MAAELFPTPVRSTATAIGMAICTVGGFISPLIIDLEVIHISIPYFCFGFLRFFKFKIFKISKIFNFSSVGFLFTLLLPETKDLELIQDMKTGFQFHEKNFISNRWKRKQNTES